MTPSRRFVVASFFAAIALSALCSSIFSIIDTAYNDTRQPINFIALFYSASFAMFMIKYFVDDVIDDRHDDAEQITRNSLALMVIAWTLFILAALFAKDTFISATLWATGLISITIFLHRNRMLIEHHARLYLCQNILLIGTLLLLAMSSLPRFVLALPPSTIKSCPEISICTWIMTGLLTILNVCFFAILLRDDTKTQK